MNICLLVNSFNLGGAEKLCFDIAEQLNMKGYKPLVLSMKAVETELEKSISNGLKAKGIDVATVNKPVGNGRLRAIISIRKILKKYNIDVLHTNGQSPDFYGRLATLLLKKVKVVTTIHNTKGYSRKIEGLLRALTDEYTAVSDEAAEYCKNSLLIKNVQVIDNGIDFSRYEASEKRKSNIILSVGRVVEQKGYINIVEAMCAFLASNKEYYWYIVGDTCQDEKYFEQVKALTKIGGVSNRVVFTGAINNVEEYYRKADLFILPSIYEGFGIAFIEAMAARLPVICNNVGVINNIKLAGGRVFELENGKLCELIEQAYNITEKELDFNYGYCKKNYSIEAVTDKYIEVYSR